MGENFLIMPVLPTTFVNTNEILQKTERQFRFESVKIYREVVYLVGTVRNAYKQHACIYRINKTSNDGYQVQVPQITKSDVDISNITDIFRIENGGSSYVAFLMLGQSAIDKDTYVSSGESLLIYAKEKDD